MVVKLIVYVGVSLVVICTPGPDTALTVRNAFAGGRRSGVWTAAGVAIGQLVWTVAASLGIAGVIRASEPVFVTMKLLGAGYLVYLGIQSLLAARRAGTEPGATGPAPRTGAVRSLRQGLLNDLANPKMAAFFVSLLPQFAPASGHALPTMLGLGAIFSTLTFAWLALYSLAVDKLRRVFSRARVRRAIDAVAGTVLIGFGVRLAVSN
ncbi:LysE family translocator [Micromonospora zhanjiangensis]|uniref:LysE family translocator n=1 Tax=Micromonospora zhanjiangensis TaxID=1522057 RepID=A0ABV8KSQ1_9ACTN